MKDRRGFLKLLGIGAGAACAAVAARIATQTPTTPPRTIQDIEKPTPYIGPNGVPGGDYIKERPKVVPEHIKLPELTPNQHQWIVDGQKIMTFDLTPPPQFTFDGGMIDMSEIDWDTPGNIILTPDPELRSVTEVVHTTGTYDHNLGGYSLENTWTAEPFTDEFGL